jgi:hypothetical protein
MAFHVVSLLLGDEVALETARHMEYDWSSEKARSAEETPT